MSYGQPHSATIPTVAATTGTTYASMVNDVLAEMRATLNAKVTPAGIQINADLSMRSAGMRYGLTDIHRLSLYQQPAQLAAGTYPAALFASADGELYFNDAAGNSVQLTNGGALNGTPGSITGAGYGSAGVEVNWDSGASDYHLYSGSGSYADVNVHAVQLSDGSGNQLRLAAPAMAADYTLTFPAAVPGSSNSVLQMATTGALTATATPTVTTLTTTGAATIGGALTAAGGVTGGLAITGATTVSTTLGVTGATTLSSTLGVTGLITATAGLTAASGQHVTVSGTGRFKHGSMARTIGPAAAQVVQGSPTNNDEYWQAGGGTDVLDFPAQMTVGERITAINVSVNDSGAGSLSTTLWRVNLTTGTKTSIGSASSAGTGWQYITVSGLTEDVTAEYAYFVRVTAAASGDRISGVVVSYTFP